MIDALQDPVEELNYSQLLRVRHICDSYVALWQGQRRPSIERYLAHLYLDGLPSAQERSALLGWLLAEELERRRGLGELPSPDEVLERFPEDGACIQPIFTPESGVDTIALTAKQNVQEEGAGVHEPRYQVLREHARGGLGIVSRARDRELARDVAIKEMREDRAHDSVSRARFLLEAEITGRLQHPGVVPVYSLGQFDDGRSYYTMRFVSGETLREAIGRFHGNEPPVSAGRSRPKPTLQQLLQRFIDVCNTVAYAHSQRVIHRDIKPDNIYLGEYGETIMLDWGLAKVFAEVEGTPQSYHNVHMRENPDSWLPSGSADHTAAGVILGSPSYMSPEQAAGQPNRVGPASDVYGLGAVLYSILTGQPPARGASPSEILEKVRTGKIAPPRDRDPSIHPALDAVCRKAMAREPGSRYSSPKALAEEVELWLSDQPVSAYKEPWWVPMRRRAQRHKALVSSAAVGVIVAVLGLTISLAFLSKKNASLQSANIRAERRVDLAIEAIETFRKSVETNLSGPGRPDPEVLRKTLLKAPLDFYRKLRQDIQTQGDVGVQTTARLSVAVFSIGILTDRTASKADAERAYEEASRVLRPLARQKPEYGEKLARCLTNRANCLHDLGRSAETLPLLDEAVHINEELANRYPKVRAYPYALALTLGVRAGLPRPAKPGHDAASSRESPQNDLDRGISILRKLLRDQPDDLDVRALLIDQLSQLAGILANPEHGERSLSLIGEARSLAEEVAGSHPDFAVTQIRCETRSGFIIGSILGRHTEALDHFARARDLYEKRIREQPRDFETQNRYASFLINYSMSLNILKRYDEAIAIGKRGSEIFENLVREQPEIPGYRGGLASLLVNLGGALASRRRLEEACSCLTRAQELFLDFTSREPEVAAHKLDYAKATINLSFCYEKSERWAEALKEVEKARDLVGGLLHKEPGDHMARCVLGVVYQNLGWIQFNQGRLADAEEDYRKAIAYQKQILDKVSDSSRYLDLAYQSLADALTNQGKHEALASAAREFIELGPGQGERLYWAAARGFSTCAAMVMSKKTMPAGERDTLARRYGEQAIETLRRAIAAGWKDLHTLQNDPLLNLLRSRGDFQILTMDLAFPADPFAH